MRKHSSAIWAVSVSLLCSAAIASGNNTKSTAGDAEALATLVAADQHEVAMAKQALGKGVTGGVHDYAVKMQADHGKNLDDTRRVARENKVSTAPTAGVREMEKQGHAEMASLASLKGDAYAKAYAEAMVKGHTEVLGKLDTVLIPGATDPEVVAHLKATRDAVAMHLEAAKKL